MPLLQLPREVDLPRDADERVFGRQIAVRRRERGGADQVRVVIRRARRRADPADAQRLDHSEHRRRSLQIATQPGRVAAERIGIRTLPRLGLAAAVGADAERPGVGDRHPDADLQPGRLGADPGDDLAQEPRPILDRPAVAPRPVDGREKLVAEIAVAVLHIHEGEAGPPGLRRGADEVVDEPGDLVVGEDVGRLVRPEPAVEHRVAIERHGLVAALVMGTRVAARVDELEADEQVVLAPEVGDVLGDEALPHRRDRAQVPLGDEQLLGIIPPVLADGDGLAAPDQLGARSAEAEPPPESQLGGRAVGIAVPALHRQDREPVADRPAIDDHRLRQGGVGAVGDVVVERDLGAAMRERLAESVGGLEGGDAGDIHEDDLASGTGSSRERDAPGCRGARRDPTRGASACPGGWRRGRSSRGA